ncbi:MAG: ABC transporter substrate-binding protein [Solirubrobacterales bacterium]
MVLAVAALALAACGGGGSTGGGGGESGGETGSSGESEGTPTDGGTLKVADASEAITLSPFTEVPDNNSVHVFAQIIEPLYRTNKDNEIEPVLAETTEHSKDYKTWTIGLRKGAKFSDGKPLTAEDVVFSLETARANPTWKAFFEPIESVSAKSNDAVVVKTRSTFPTLETTLSLFAAGIVPKDFGGISEKEFERKPMGTGPFMLSKWVPGKSLTLVKNPHYWNPELPHLDSVVFETAPSDESRTLQLRGGQLDLIATPPQAQLESIENTSGLQVNEFGLSIPDFLLLNLREPIFKDKRVREAVDLAVDRQGVINAALSGRGQPGGSWFPPTLDFHDASIKPPRDIEKAKELLAEAVKDGVDPTFTLTVFAGQAYANFASQILQENLEEVGFTMKIQQLDEATTLEKVFGNEYEASLYGITSDIPEPSEIVSFYIELEALATGAETEPMAKLLQEALAEPNEAKRGELYNQIQEIVANDHNMVILDYRPWTWASQDNVVGFNTPPTGIPYFAEVGFSG